MTYTQFYKLAGRPFQLTPDPRFYFESATHRKAMAYLGYGLAQGEGFIVITGDIGAGKTTLVGHLMETIDPRRLVAVKIAASEMDGDTALRLAARAFGMDTDGVDRADMLGGLEAFMYQQARQGRRCLLIVDEAQELGHDALEALRILSNCQLGGQPLIQIFLLGQPEFRHAMSGAGHLEQLRQRVIATHHLGPMLPGEVRPYIEHRLGVVGWVGNPHFDAEAIELIAQESRGVPRLVNALAQAVLERAGEMGCAQIDHSLVDAVCIERRGALLPSSESAKTVAALARARPSMREEVRELKQAIGTAERQDEDLVEVRPGAREAEMDRNAQIEARLARIEARLDQQDEMFATILSRMIEWIDEDEAAREEVAHRAA